MKIILNEDIPRVGKKYEVKNVADGFARNFLLPQKKAVAATPRAVKRAQEELARTEQNRAEKERLKEKELHAITGKEIKTTAKASEKGGLFAGIGKKELLKILRAGGYETITEENIEIDEPIKTTGTHTIPLLLHGEKTGEFSLIIEPEK